MVSRKELEKIGVEEHSIFWDIFWTVLTLGFFNLWVQIRQIQDTNSLLNKDNFSFIKVMIFSILTLGIYFCYHEYKMTRELSILVNNDKNDLIPLLAAVATFFGLWFIVDSYQQNLINDYLERLDVHPGQ